MHKPIKFAARGFDGACFDCFGLEYCWSDSVASETPAVVVTRVVAEDLWIFAHGTDGLPHWGLPWYVTLTPRHPTKNCHQDEQLSV